MKFAELANYFEKLEATSSRLAMIDILAELFKRTPASEIEKIVYLIQGRLAPFFVPLEIGMAEKTVAQSIANAYGLEKEGVLSFYQKLGDMGLVAEKISQKTKIKGQSLSVDQVFVILNQIANTKGEGTVGKRQTMLSELLQKLDSISVKHLVRIPLGKTRLGIGDPTVLDALATAKLGDKAQRKVLEYAYNRTSDLGLIARTLWNYGLSAVLKLKVMVGHPIRSELCERLPSPEKVIEKMIEVDVQYKYDGFRVQIHKLKNDIRMFSRNLEEMTHMFPELTEAARKQIKAENAILDTEALAYNPESEEFLPFQETTKRRRKHGIDELAKALPLKAFVFDILYKDGKQLLDEPLKKRMEILRETIIEDDILIRAKDQTVTDPRQLGILLDDAISKGLEGLVVKKLDSKYEAGGRNFNWVKLKRHSAGELQDTIDCVILGYVYGRGKRTAFGAGALLVGVYDSERDEFVTVSKIGTGLTDDEWRSIKEKTHGLELTHKPARVSSLITPSVWVKPEIVIEVLADEITRSPVHTAGMISQKSLQFGGQAKVKSQKSARKDSLERASELSEKAGVGYALRFPRLVSFRDKDKKAEDATTVKELIEMYQEQGKR